MDASSKLLLEEMKKMGDRIDKRLDNLDSRLGNLEKRGDNDGNRFKQIMDKAEEIASWKDGVDSSVADLISKLDSVEILVGKVGVVNKEGEVDALKAQVSNLNTKLD
jgi:phage-related minor tail protein